MNTTDLLCVLLAVVAIVLRIESARTQRCLNPVVGGGERVLLLLLCAFAVVALFVLLDVYDDSFTKTHVSDEQ